MIVPTDCKAMCRLCLVKDRVDIPIFEELNDQIFTKISTCLPLTISREDILPKNICHRCNIKLDEHYQFWNTSVNADKQLKSWLGLEEESVSKSETEKNKRAVNKKFKRNGKKNTNKIKTKREFAALDYDSPDDDFDTIKDNSDVDLKEENSSDERLSSTESEKPKKVDVDEIAKNSKNKQSQLKALLLAKPNKVQRKSVKQKKNYMEKCIKTENGVSCKDCNRLFTTEKSFRKHYVQHAEDRPFKCHLCDKSYRFNWELNTHIKRVHQKAYRVKCDHCDRTFDSKSSLENHRNRALEIYPYKCTICDEKYHTNSSLELHVNRVHKGITYKCDTCGKSFSNSNNLNTHKIQVHDPNFKFKYAVCEICNKVCTSRGYLNKHLKKHQGFTCHVCGKVVTSKSSLDQHLRIHSGERPFACEICGKSFSKKDVLKVHIRSHEGVRPYQCKICGKSFTQSTSRAIHMRGHTGERPYPCTLCSDAFVTRTLLKNHMKKNHCVNNETGF